VIGMVVARIVAPDTKLATTRWWQTRTLAEDLNIGKADEDDLYAAMDWLLKIAELSFAHLRVDTSVVDAERQLWQ